MSSVEFYTTNNYVQQLRTANTYSKYVQQTLIADIFPLCFLQSVISCYSCNDYNIKRNEQCGVLHDKQLRTANLTI